MRMRFILFCWFFVFGKLSLHLTHLDIIFLNSFLLIIKFTHWNIILRKKHLIKIMSKCNQCKPEYMFFFLGGGGEATKYDSFLDGWVYENRSSMFERVLLHKNITFSFTSSSASTNSSRFAVFFSPSFTAFDGSSHASLIDLRPKNIKRVTAAYSPTGNAVYKTTASVHYQILFNKLTSFLIHTTLMVYEANYRPFNNQRKCLRTTQFVM